MLPLRLALELMRTTAWRPKAKCHMLRAISTYFWQSLSMDNTRWPIVLRLLVSCRTAGVERLRLLTAIWIAILQQYQLAGWPTMLGHSTSDPTWTAYRLILECVTANILQAELVLRPERGQTDTSMAFRSLVSFGFSAFRFNFSSIIIVSNLCFAYLSQQLAVNVAVGQSIGHPCI